MSNAPLAKLAAADLPALLPLIEAPEPLSAQLGACPSAAAALELLAGQADLSPALRLLAHGLPRREAVWWVCMCARAVPAERADPADEAALEAAELWVRRPTDENRREAFRRAEAARFATPEAWASVAAFWSGDSMSPAGQPAVPPPPDAAGKAVFGAVLLASLRRAPEKQAERLGRFIASARDIASGGTGRLPAETG